MPLGAWSARRRHQLLTTWRARVEANVAGTCEDVRLGLLRCMGSSLFGWLQLRAAPELPVAAGIVLVGVCDLLSRSTRKPRTPVRRATCAGCNAIVGSRSQHKLRVRSDRPCDRRDDCVSRIGLR